MPNDWYDFFRKIISDETLKESSDYVREKIWRVTQDVRKSQDWQRRRR